MSRPFAVFNESLQASKDFLINGYDGNEEYPIMQYNLFRFAPYKNSHTTKLESWAWDSYIKFTTLWIILKTLHRFLFQVSIHVKKTEPFSFLSFAIHSVNCPHSQCNAYIHYRWDMILYISRVFKLSPFRTCLCTTSWL